MEEADKYDAITKVLDPLPGVYSWSGRGKSVLQKIYILFLVKYYQSLCLGSTKLVVSALPIIPEDI